MHYHIFDGCDGETDTERKGCNVLIIDRVKFGERLRQLRERACKSLYRVGEDVGCGQTAYARWERGECLPSTSYLPGLALSMGGTVDDLLQECIVDISQPAQAEAGGAA